ncbi:hypothetical protein PIB30_021163 [Stylosanthes scabra]|uniref:Uncharacterized protein n=1 Tax=Stylosanthes scabra TaxID=79078 RepID=A0ABU6S9A2_9FABA|nr:hypothetical protein [Stylosanthes scabra]
MEKNGGKYKKRTAIWEFLIIEQHHHIGATVKNKNPRPAPSYLRSRTTALRRPAPPSLSPATTPHLKSTYHHRRSSKLTVSPRISLSLVLTHRSPLRVFNLRSLLVQSIRN